MKILIKVLKSEIDFSFTLKMSNYLSFHAFDCNNYVFTYTSTLSQKSKIIPSHFTLILS